MSTIAIFGHKNPDNDSVVSATAYAYLKNAEAAKSGSGDTYIATRLGAMPKESAWLFDKLGLEYPVEVSSAADLIALGCGCAETGEKPSVILVDHNETSQSLTNLATEAQVVEIMDHHRVGDVQTAGPILSLCVPIGSTASIITSRFQHLHIDAPKEITTILLAAILTDTVILKSPTATDFDRHLVENLSKITGNDPVEFGMELFSARSAGETFDPVKVLGRDAKEFQIGDRVALIAQYETVSTAEPMENLDEIESAAIDLMRRNNYSLVLLMITDIIKEGSEIFAVGDTDLVEKALEISLENRTAWMPGVLSRKKQVAAKVVEHGN